MTAFSLSLFASLIRSILYTATLDGFASVSCVDYISTTCNACKGNAGLSVETDPRRDVVGSILVACHAVPARAGRIAFMYSRSQYAHGGCDG